MLHRLLLFTVIVLLASCARQRCATSYTGGYTDAGKQLPEEAISYTGIAVKQKAKANPRHYYAREKTVRMRATGHLPLYNY